MNSVSFTPWNNDNDDDEDDKHGGGGGSHCGDSMGGGLDTSGSRFIF